MIRFARDPASVAVTDRASQFRRNRVLVLIVTIYAGIWVVTAITATNRFDWFLENILVVVFVALLVHGFARIRISNLSYLLIFSFLSLHAIGANTTYSESVPGFWLQETFGWDRNHYDRVVHFLFGLLFAYPLREFLTHATGVRPAWRPVLCGAVILGLSNLYEIIEWIAARIIEPEAAMAFLGTQGDVFDAQKDSALAFAGAVLGLTLTALAERGLRAYRRSRGHRRRGHQKRGHQNRKKPN